MDERQLRLDAAAAVGKAIGKSHSILSGNGHRGGSTIVVVLESDAVEEVIHRAMTSVPKPPATVAVYWPGSGRVEFISLAPGDAANVDLDAPVPVSGTIGMLVEDLSNRSSHSVTFTTSASSTFIQSFSTAA